MCLCSDTSTLFVRRGRGANSAPPPAAAAGFYLVRGALGAEQQRRLVTEALTEYAEPPNHTNFLATHGGLPGLWDAAQRGLRLVKLPASGSAAGTAAAAQGVGVWSAAGAGPPASAVLHKLRWATLGPPYDWTQRRYLQDQGCAPLPAWLAALARELVAAVTTAEGGSCPEAVRAAGGPGRGAPPPRGADGPGARAFDPDVGLVNFYREGDTLGGHRDDAEEAWETQPIVSLSAGCDAVFLVGGATKARRRRSRGRTDSCSRCRASRRCTAMLVCRPAVPGPAGESRSPPTRCARAGGAPDRGVAAQRRRGGAVRRGPALLPRSAARAARGTGGARAARGGPRGPVRALCGLHVRLPDQPQHPGDPVA